MDGQMDGQLDRQLKEWVGGWTDGKKEGRREGRTVFIHVGKVKSAYEPSDPSGRSLSWFQ